METRNRQLADSIRRNWREAELTPRETALCEYAEKLTRHPDRMQPEDLEPLKAAGLSDRGLLDLAQVAGYFNYINRLADGLGVDLEPDADASHT